MRTIDLRNQKLEDKVYGVAMDVRLVIAGAENGSTGYGLGITPKGRSGRKVFQGPLVAGPWAYTFGLATVICANPAMGTGAERERERAEGRLVECEAGDELILSDDLTVRVELCRRGFPTLVNV